MIKISNKWEDYQLLDAGNGEKLELWANIMLRRPDPQAMWSVIDYSKWNNINALYERSDTGGGSWQYFKDLPSF